MKSIKYIVFVFLCLFFNIFCVNAECTSDEIDVLKSKAKDIKITYKHKGIIEKDDYIDYYSFDVTINNFIDDFYITYLAGTKKIIPINDVANVVLHNGDWTFKVVSNKCKKEIEVIKFKLPKFNLYSLDPLCEGIDGNDFPLCGKYYEYDVSYDNFVERVEHYRSIYNINNDKPVNNDDNSKLNEMFDLILNFVLNYWIYIAISLIILFIIFVIIIIIAKRKKRGVLK